MPGEWAMRSRRIFAVVAGAAMTVAAAVAFVPSSMAAVSSATAVPMVACTAPAWAEGVTYPAGAQVTYPGRLYQALVTHTAWPAPAGTRPPRRRCGGPRRLHRRHPPDPAPTTADHAAAHHAAAPTPTDHDATRHRPRRTTDAARRDHLRA